jgi:RNA polymerase sigma-54 factor
MSLKLQQKLSFQMIQSLKLLQVNTLQLEQLLKTELELNPVLEAAEDLETETETADAAETETKSDDDPELEVGEDSIDWEEYLEDGFDLGGRMSEDEAPQRERYEPAPVYQTTLSEYLEEQLAGKRISERMLLLIRFLIGSLDPDGYLRYSLDDIAEHTKTSIFEVEEAVNILWNMEPPGIGARTLQECLVLQLKARKLQETLAMRIVAQTWDLFEKMKVPEIARHFGVDTKEVQAALNTIRTLTPKPGYAVSGERSSTIIPDLIVEKADGEFIVTLNDRSVPMLHVNRTYTDMLKRGSPAKADIKKYVREKLNNAAWLIRSIEQRKTTMLKVMYAIIEKQRLFFEQGPPNLNPLRLQDVADMIGMHISTVSRVTSNKYVQTPHGIFELKYFFTEAIGQDAEGGDISSERIKNRIRELVENENAAKPHSDQRISELLTKEDLHVARRTVAKYREQLRILPARLRQRYE